MRYGEYDYSQGKFIPIHFYKQITPRRFEHTLHYLSDNEIDLSVFDLRYQNDAMGAPAYDGDTFEDNTVYLLPWDHLKREDREVL